MAPSRPPPSLVVRTPRHASRRVRPALAAEIRKIEKRRTGLDIELDEKHAANNPTHPLGIASDNASEWNSLLITARAERGPQWDVATQRFMVDYGSHLYFDPVPLALPEEPTPPPEDPHPPGPPPGDPSLPWQSDPRFLQYGGNPNLANVATAARTSHRLQHQMHHHQIFNQQQHLLQNQPLNGHGGGNPMGNAYPYGLTNGRIPEHQQQHPQQHPQQHYGQVHMQQSYYDTQAQNIGHGQTAVPVHHAMTNGIPMGSPGMGVAAGNPMLARQMGMGTGLEFGGGIPEADMRRRTRNPQDLNMEMGW